MQIACSSRSFSREIPARLPLAHFPAWCGSRGIPAIEIDEEHLTSREPDYLTMLLRACGNANVTVAALALYNDFTVPDADEHFRQVEHVRRMLHEVAKPLNAKMVRVFLGMSDLTAAGEERALETFRSLLPDLEATGIMLAVENHARVQTPPDRMAAVIAGAHSPLVGACVDLGSLPLDRHDIYLQHLGPLARYVHARTAAFDLDGEELHIDFKRAFAYLTEFGFDGVISIIYEGIGDQYQGVLNTMALIEKHWYHPEAGGMAA
ncbi:MAG: sugar phosphate isomerase/epimerase family protein [Armatimonadota bacterium]